MSSHTHQSELFSFWAGQIFTKTNGPNFVHYVQLIANSSLQSTQYSICVKTTNRHTVKGEHFRVALLTNDSILDVAVEPGFWSSQGSAHRFLGVRFEAMRINVVITSEIVQIFEKRISSYT